MKNAVNEYKSVNLCYPISYRRQIVLLYFNEELLLSPETIDKGELSKVAGRYGKTVEGAPLKRTGLENSTK